MKLVCDWEKAIKLAAKPNYDCATIFDDNLVAIHMKSILSYTYIDSNLNCLHALTSPRMVHDLVVG